MIMFGANTAFGSPVYPTSANGIIVLLNSPRWDIAIEFY